MVETRAIAGMIEALFERYVSPDGLAVDYEAMHSTEANSDFLRHLSELSDFDPTSLELREERLAFWINLYNMAMIQEVGTLDGAVSVKDDKGFFGREVCRLGGLGYSLDDIEFGILRDNGRQAGRPWRKWRSWDVRRNSAVHPPDPRVCFALARASRSGPALSFYEAAVIEGQLYEAAARFIRDGGVIIDRELNTLSISELLRGYSADFGGGQGVIRFIADHVGPEDAALIRSQAGNMNIRYHALSKELNSALQTP